MSWLAVDKDGTETIFQDEPIRLGGCFTVRLHSAKNQWVELPKGSIKKLIGKDLTWYDKPYQI